MSHEPTLRDVIAEIKNLSTKSELNDRFAHWDKKLDNRFAKSDKKHDEQHQEIMEGFAEVIDTINDHSDKEIKTVKYAVRELAKGNPQPSEELT